MSEIWKDIEGYEEKYQVSNLGRVKSLSRKVQFGNTFRITPEKFLKYCDNGKGYQYVCLGKGVENRRYIHRLVAEAFIPNPLNLPEVNHKDCNPRNCIEENLEWCDAKYNNNYGNHNEKHSKPVDQYTPDGILVKTWKSIKEAESHIHRKHIWDCCVGKREKCGGYIWKYHVSAEDVLKQLDDLFNNNISDEDLQ